MKRFRPFGMIDAIKFIEDSVNHSKRVTIEDVAKIVGYSPMHCNVVFKEYLGEPIGSYVHCVKMEKARKELDRTGAVVQTAQFLLMTPRGFRKAFKTTFGVTPSQYVKTGTVKCKYLRTYEYGGFSSYNVGDNPSSDGLWEYAYYDPKTKKHALMQWNGRIFHAPVSENNKTDPNWYCYNRTSGYGMHPSKGLQAVRSFICPHDGTVEIFAIVGRSSTLKKGRSPTYVQFFRNGTPIFPTDEAFALKSSSAVLLKTHCNVRKEDKIHFHVGCDGNIDSTGIFVYRQQIRYLTLEEDVL